MDQSPNHITIRPRTSEGCARVGFRHITVNRYSGEVRYQPDFAGASLIDVPAVDPEGNNETMARRAVYSVIRAIGQWRVIRMIRMITEGGPWRPVESHEDRIIGPHPEMDNFPVNDRTLFCRTEGDLRSVVHEMRWDPDEQCWLDRDGCDWTDHSTIVWAPFGTPGIAVHCPYFDPDPDEDHGPAIPTRNVGDLLANMGDDELAEELARRGWKTIRPRWMPTEPCWAVMFDGDPDHPDQAERVVGRFNQYPDGSWQFCGAYEHPDGGTLEALLPELVADGVWFAPIPDEVIAGLFSKVLGDVRRLISRPDLSGSDPVR